MSLLETKAWVSDWLWSSKKRSTINCQWDSQYITDAAQMIEDHLPDTGKGTKVMDLERKVRELQVQLATLRSLLEETRSMHLRTEEHRDWLERRDSALDMP